MDVITQHCPNSSFQCDLGLELKYKLSYEDQSKFGDLFRSIEMEKDKESGKIESFGIGLSSLEEVFLKVAK